jgi:hypothetical protein
MRKGELVAAIRERQAKDARLPEAATRRRVPPSTRFEDKERLFDLDAAFAQLPEESVARNGHMQKALYRYGPTTTAIFAFGQDAVLDRYWFEGQAIIQVVRGSLRVTTDDETYDLSESQVLLLDPEVPQSFRALAPTQVLVTLITED